LLANAWVRHRLLRNWWGGPAWCPRTVAWLGMSVSSTWGRKMWAFRRECLSHELLGAEVVPVQSVKNAERCLWKPLRDWVTCDDTFLLIGTWRGHHPYPAMVRDFQSVIGEARQKCSILRQTADTLVACIGGGFKCYWSVLFLSGWIGCKIGVEGVVMVCNGQAFSSYRAETGCITRKSLPNWFRDADGANYWTQSISAGLDYPGVGPEHAWLKDIVARQYVRDGYELWCIMTWTYRRIIPLGNSTHWRMFPYAQRLSADKSILINVSGTCDKAWPRLQPMGLNFWGILNECIKNFKIFHADGAKTALYLMSLCRGVFGTWTW